MTAPAPIDCIVHHAGPNRIEDDVTRQLQQVGVLFNQDALAAALEHMAHASVPTVGPLSLDAIELAHATGQVALGRFDHQVVVVGHLAEGMTTLIEPLADIAQQSEPGQTIIRIEIDGLAPVATCRHVIQTAG